MNTFTKDLLHVDDVVVYLKNERTGSSTIRKCKFVGHIVNFTKSKVNIRRLSPPDTFVTPDEIQDLGIDAVSPDDVVHVIISKHEERETVKLLRELNGVISRTKNDVKLLIGMWFAALEDNGVDPWKSHECMELADKYDYTEEDYREYLNTLV